MINISSSRLASTASSFIELKLSEIQEYQKLVPWQNLKKIISPLKIIRPPAKSLATCLYEAQGDFYFKNPIQLIILRRLESF